jgi:uncharacterized membrane protein YedE/YeeE
VTITSFTPYASLIGGSLIGLAAVLLMAIDGRIAGVSGISARLFSRPGADWVHAFLFIAGLACAPLLYGLAAGNVPKPDVDVSVLTLIVAGALVGFGSVLGSGCTSGHGVCGLSRFSMRSLVATMTFMGTAVVTVFLVRHFL